MFATPSVFLRTMTPYSNIQGKPVWISACLIAAVPETYSQPLHLHHISDICHVPFDNVQCYVLSMTPSFPMHHLVQICSATEAVQIIHLVTKGKVTYHPQGNESLYNEVCREKKAFVNRVCVF